MCENGSTADNIDLESGLVAFYPFNGNGNDGIVVAATLTQDRYGNADSASAWIKADTVAQLKHIFDQKQIPYGNI